MTYVSSLLKTCAEKETEEEKKNMLLFCLSGSQQSGKHKDNVI